MKNFRSNSLKAFLLILMALASGNAFPGKTCENVVIDARQVGKVFDDAATLAQKLQASGQRLAILVRQGQNLKKYGITFSHAAFVLRNGNSWVVYHDLNKCGTATASLYAQGLAEFLADGLVSQDIAIIFPQPDIQSRLEKILVSKDTLFRMHSPDYSAAAYPFSTRYQNSNGWILETFAMAASDKPLQTRTQAQSWLRQHGYQGDVIMLRALTRLAARTLKANIAFDDHPDELRWTHQITVNTGDAVLRFVAKYGMTMPDCQPDQFGPAVCIISLTPA